MAIQSPKQKQSKLTSLCRSCRNSVGKQLTVNGLYVIYKDYKEKSFPRLLEDPTVPNEDKEKIKGLLAKPFNPYVRRHSALTEKSTKLKSSILNQHAGWTTNSAMANIIVSPFEIKEVNTRRRKHIGLGCCRV